MSARKNKGPRDALPLRIIPISKSGDSGLTMQLVPTDDQEAAVRKKAASQELLAGTAMRIR